MTVTSALVRENVLNPAMESLAHNLDQYDPSEKCDSDLERALAALDAGDHDSVRHFILEVIASNVLEGAATGQVAEFSDRLTADLHRLETGTGSTGLSTKAICRRLRDSLKIVRNPAGHPVAKVTEAHLCVKATVRQVPHAELLKASVKRELGVKLTEVLERYVNGVEA